MAIHFFKHSSSEFFQTNPAYHTVQSPFEPLRKRFKDSRERLFTLSLLTGSLIFSSCILGGYLFFLPLHFHLAPIHTMLSNQIHAAHRPADLPSILKISTSSWFSAIIPFLAVFPAAAISFKKRSMIPMFMAFPLMILLIFGLMVVDGTFYKPTIHSAIRTPHHPTVSYAPELLSANHLALQVASRKKPLDSVDRKIFDSDVLWLTHHHGWSKSRHSRAIEASTLDPVTYLTRLEYTAHVPYTTVAKSYIDIKRFEIKSDRSFLFYGDRINIFLIFLVLCFSSFSFSLKRSMRRLQKIMGQNSRYIS